MRSRHGRLEGEEEAGRSGRVGSALLSQQLAEAALMWETGGANGRVEEVRTPKTNHTPIKPQTNQVKKRPKHKSTEAQMSQTGSNRHHHLQFKNPPQRGSC